MHNFLFFVGATQVITADYAGKTLSKSYVILFLKCHDFVMILSVSTFWNLFWYNSKSFNKYRSWLTRLGGQQIKVTIRPT